MTNFSNRGKNLHLGVANAEGGGKWGECIGFYSLPLAAFHSQFVKLEIFVVK